MIAQAGATGRSSTVPDLFRMNQKQQLLAAGGLGIFALWVRVGWVPIERHRFDGHEAELLQAFLGQSPAWSTRVQPAAAILYSGLGSVISDPRALIALQLLSGLACVGLAGIWASREWGAKAGWWTALLLTLTPAQAFWSSSAYPVILPLAFLMGALVVRGWRGALLYAIACALRPDLAALAPAVGLLGGWKLTPGALGALAVAPVIDTAPALRPFLETLPVNLPLTAYMGPLGTIAGGLLVALAVQKTHWRLLAAAAWVHLVGSLFDDYGTRHALFGGVCLTVLVAQGRGWRQWLAPAAAILLSLGVSDMAHWYYADATRFAATLPVLPPPPPDCEELLDDPLAASSHWNLRKAWPEGRVCWGEEHIHRAWTSRGLQDRALRMHNTYTLAPLGLLNLPGGPRLVHEVAR